MKKPKWPDDDPKADMAHSIVMPFEGRWWIVFRDKEPQGPYFTSQQAIKEWKKAQDKTNEPR